MAPLAITVLGHDRPGIIADVTTALAQRDANVEDSSMTLLWGTSRTLTSEREASVEQVASEPGLPVLRRPGGQCPAGDRRAGGGPQVQARPFIVSVHGADRVGIVAAITGAIASYGGNVTDLQTRLGGGLYVVVAEVDFAEPMDADVLAGRLRAVGQTVGVDVAVQAADQTCCDLFAGRAAGGWCGGTW